MRGEWEFARGHVCTAGVGFPGSLFYWAWNGVLRGVLGILGLGKGLGAWAWVCFSIVFSCTIHAIRMVRSSFIAERHLSIEARR